MRSLAGDVIKHAFSQQTDEKLHRRLYAAICSCILEGSLKPATRMPPSRDLAGELMLSRNTVLRVYEQLQKVIFLRVPVAAHLSLTACWTISTCVPIKNLLLRLWRITPAYLPAALSC